MKDSTQPRSDKDRLSLKRDRLIDANGNRLLEGLRVCEDVCRFIFDEPRLTRRWKRLRHEAEAGLSLWSRNRLWRARAVEMDVGRGDIRSEFHRNQWSDVFEANASRVKESLRVLEEAAKLEDVAQAKTFKRLRYRVYTLEKETGLRLRGDLVEKRPI